MFFKKGKKEKWPTWEPPLSNSTSRCPDLEMKNSQLSYPITSLKGAAPLTGSLMNLSIVLFGGSRNYHDLVFAVARGSHNSRNRVFSRKGFRRYWKVAQYPRSSFLFRRMFANIPQTCLPRRGKIVSLPPPCFHCRRRFVQLPRSCFHFYQRSAQSPQTGFQRCRQVAQYPQSCFLFRRRFAHLHAICMERARALIRITRAPEVIG